MLTLFLIGCVAIIVSGFHQYYKWQLSLYQAELSRLEWENHCQAERIQKLEQERARLHWQLLCNLNKPGQEIGVYRN